MPTAGLDAFQILIALYLFYTAVKGRGTLFNFPGIPEKKSEDVRRKLRIAYAVGGLICLLDGAVSMLQNDMFTVNYTEKGSEIIRNYTIETMPFITYERLQTVSLCCIAAILLLLAWVFMYVRKQQKP